MNSIFPWQKALWQKFKQHWQMNRVAHAWVFTGPDGVGKEYFTNHLMNKIICRETIEEYPCKQCQHCLLFAAKNHPDVMILSPNAGEIIKIEQIRMLAKFVERTPLLSNYRVIMINNAHQMNIYASNALLKTLEEPTANTFLFLITTQSSLLLPTIKSRCQKMVFYSPSFEEAHSWLTKSKLFSNVKEDELSILFKLTNRAPLKMKTLLEQDTLTLRKLLYASLVNLFQGKLSPLKAASDWQEKDFALTLYFLESLVSDVMKWQLLQEPNYIINTDYLLEIKKTAAQMNIKKGWQYIKLIHNMYEHYLSLANVNSLLSLEKLFIHWTLLCS